MLDKAIIFLAIISSLIADEVNQNVAGICKDFCKCDENTDIFNLDCKDAGLRRVLAEWPTQNKTLRATFSYNRIESLQILPKSDAEVEVVLSYCSIRYLDPRVFENMPKIKFVDLSHNLLTSEELDSSAFAGPYNSTNEKAFEPLYIRHLDLSYNDIHSLNKDLLQHLVVLEELNLEGNDLKILDPSTQMALSSVKTLRKLNLANNSLTELIGVAIDGLENLSVLDLSYNNLDFVPYTLANLSNSLQKLNLTGNPIFELTDESFLGLTNLWDLSLSNLPLLKTIFPNTFSPLTNLQRLELNNNPLLTNLDAEVFPVHPDNLLEVYLNNNSLTDIDFRILDWGKLRIVQFQDNPLKCTCNLYEIKKQLDSSILRDLDGPRCMDRRVFKSRAVFSLTSDLCDPESDELHISRVDKHFNILKIIVITVGVILTLTALIVSLVAYLRVRKSWRNAQYPFTTQVRYNPVNINQALH